MFCEKCGKAIEDNALFCPNCGGQTNAGNNVQAPAVNYGASYTAVKKPVPLKYIIIPVAILAVVAIVITVLVFTLTGSSQQFQTEQLKMTINGENIPVVLSGFAYTEVDIGEYGYITVFIGRKGTKSYAVSSLFIIEPDLDCPSSNATYNSLSDRDGEYVGVMFLCMDSSNGKEFSRHTFSAPSEFKRAQVSVGEFKPNEKMGISVTGEVSNDEVSFDFSASGSLESYNDDVLTNKMNSILGEY